MKQKIYKVIRYAFKNNACQACKSNSAVGTDVASFGASYGSKRNMEANVIYLNNHASNCYLHEIRQIETRQIR